MLILANTLSGKKETLIPSDTKKITMYVCGITPYSPVHLGHARCYVTFDVLYRLLRFLGCVVTYCRNVTDIDDKLLVKAEQELGSSTRYTEITQKNMALFTQEMAQLNCLPPTVEPLVTEHIEQIIAFIADLMNKKYAYQSGKDVYFRVNRCIDYGKLSKQKIDELLAGVRINVNEQKEHALDFALWKGESDNTFWSSPWGWGRPGWHIECSALAYHYLGEYITIHGGGLDLIFPHHENEIAQSESRFGAPFAQYWIHNGLVTINKEKMSKSLGNVFNLQTIFTQYNPMVIRFYLLSHHYRSPLDFSSESLEVAQKIYEKLCKFFAAHETKNIDISMVKQYGIANQMFTMLTDDLNTQGMFGILFEHMSTLHSQEIPVIKHILVNIIGLTLQPLPEKEIVITPEIQALIDEREHARSQKNWQKADELRKKLQERGFEVQDKKIIN